MAADGAEAAQLLDREFPVAGNGTFATSDERRAGFHKPGASSAEFALIAVGIILAAVFCLSHGR